MKSDHIDQCQSRQQKPRLIYHTPFAYLALLLALTLVILIPRVTPVPEARADGANGVCEQVCEGISCSIDLNDPDCICNLNPLDPACDGGGGGGSGSCLCNEEVASSP